jgi:hypothetical protein
MHLMKRVRHDLAVELVTQHNHILELIGNRILVRISAIPDLGLAEEAEPRPLNHLGRSPEGVGAEEDGGPEDPLECCHQSPVLLATFVHVERLQHLGGGAEANRLTLLARRKRG